MRNILTGILVLFVSTLYAQEKDLPYREIPGAAENYSAGTMASRMIDGLGFRFYWATEGLRSQDLAFKPGKDARTTEETIVHIYRMSLMIRGATANTIYVEQESRLSFSEVRRKTLEALKAASDKLRESTDAEVAGYKARIQVGEQVFEVPFWNLVNGPISDCLWHTGQIVSFRRSSGNPFSEKVDLFMGSITR